MEAQIHGQMLKRPDSAENSHRQDSAQEGRQGERGSANTLFHPQKLGNFAASPAAR